MASNFANLLRQQDPRLQALSGFLPLYQSDGATRDFYGRINNLLAPSGAGSTNAPQGPPQGGPAWLQRLLGVNPALSPQEQQQAQQQALLAAGLAGLQGSFSAPGMPAPHLFQILPQMLAAGQQTSAMVQEDIARMRYKAQVRDILGDNRDNPSLPQLEALQAVALQHGDMGTFQYLGQEIARRRQGEPTATVQRGGVTVSGVSPEEAPGVLEGLPEEQPEPLTEYQREQIRLAEARLDMDRLASRLSDADPESLRKEYGSDPIIEQGADIAQSYQRVIQSAREPSAAGDLALIFNYMKMLDPGSVVRESEFATAQNAAGVPERVRAMFNRVREGERLSPQTRSDFVRRAAMIAEGQRGMVQGVANRYGMLAQQMGVDPSQVIYDPFSFISGNPGNSNTVTPPPGPAPGEVPADTNYDIDTGGLDSLIPGGNR